MTIHKTWYNSPADTVALEVAVVTQTRPTTAERIAARRERMAGIVDATVHATRESLLAEDGMFDPELEHLILHDGLSVEEAVEALCAPILGSREPFGAMELTGEPVPDFDSGVYDDQTLAVTLASCGGPGYGELVLDHAA